MGKWLGKIADVVAPDRMTPDQVAALVTSEVAKEVKQVRADMAFAPPISINYDPDNEGYRRLSGDGGQVRIDMNPWSQEYMLEMAYYLYDTSGLVKRFVRDTKNFVLGEGVDFSVENDTEDGAGLQVLNDFWTDPMNRMDLRLEKRIEFFSLLGEQVWPVSVNQYNGRVFCTYADPTNISEVYTVKNFPEMTGAVKLKGSGGRSGKMMPAIRPELDPRLPAYGKMVGEVFYFSINNPPNGPRGRSDMIHLFDFINGFEEGLFDELDRLKLIKSFVWDVKLEGASPDDIKEFLKENRVPKAGSIRAHNERVTWSAEAPTLNQQDNKAFFDLMKTYLSASMNRPDSWLGSGGKAYQTEADLMGEPTFKDLGSRQRYVKYMLEWVLQFVLDQAILHKSIREKQNKRMKAKVSMPEMSKRDLKKTVDGLFTLAQSLMIAENQNWVTRETAAKIYHTAAEQVGIDIDTADEIKNAAEKGDGTVTEDYEEKDVAVNAGGETIAQVSLNGAQIKSLLDLVQSAAAGTIQRESALEIMATAFPFDREKAERILASAGDGFSIDEDLAP